MHDFTLSYLCNLVQSYVICLKIKDQKILFIVKIGLNFHNKVNDFRNNCFILTRFLI